MSGRGEGRKGWEGRVRVGEMRRRRRRRRRVKGDVRGDEKQKERLALFIANPGR